MEGADDGEAWRRATGGHLAETWGPKRTHHLEPEVEMMRADFQRAKQATKPQLSYRKLVEDVNEPMSDEEYQAYKLGQTSTSSSTSSTLC